MIRSSRFLLLIFSMMRALSAQVIITELSAISNDRVFHRNSEGVAQLNSGVQWGENDFDTTFWNDGTTPIGFGYGDISANTNGTDSNDHTAIFANYTAGSFTFGYSLSEIDPGLATTTATTTNAWGIAMNVNDNLSVSYGEREVEFDKATAADVTEDGQGIAVAYTMGSIKVTGNRNEVGDNDGTSGAQDEMTEIAVSFAF